MPGLVGAGDLDWCGAGIFGERGLGGGPVGITGAGEDAPRHDRSDPADILQGRTVMEAPLPHRDLAEANARQAERHAIARELHDIIAHHVSSIVVRVGAARHVGVVDSGAIRHVLDDVHASAQAALTDLHDLLGVLRDRAQTGYRVEPTDVTAAIADVVKVLDRAGLCAEARIDPALAGVDGLRGAAVVRFVQEGVTNAVKHAPAAAAVTISAAVDPAGGVAVDAHNDRRRGETETGTAGYGSVGITERVSLLGGTVEAGPDRSVWRLHAVLPATMSTQVRS